MDLKYIRIQSKTFSHRYMIAFRHYVIFIHEKDSTLNCNFDRLDAVCTVGTYVDEAARNAGSTPIATFQIDLADQFHNGNYNP